MQHGEILARLQDVFRSVFGDPQLILHGHMTAADIASWDSLNNIKLLLACERAFAIRLRPRDVNAMENIDAFIGHITTRIATARG